MAKVETRAPSVREPREELAKDPVCGMVVHRATALQSEVGGRTYFFCSSGCQRTFESPEQELKSLKRRMTIALTGVVALAILRAAVFLGLAAGATTLTWVPVPWLPWFTWGVWMMILVERCTARSRPANREWRSGARRPQTRLPRLRRQRRHAPQRRPRSDPARRQRRRRDRVPRHQGEGGEGNRPRPGPEQAWTMTDQRTTVRVSCAV